MQDTSGISARKAGVMRAVLAGSALVALVACQDGFDMDVRGELGGFSTTDAARRATLDRPVADDRGVISYPNYQVAVSQRGDSVADVAARIGVNAEDLAAYNGLRTDDRLRNGEILALPSRVAEPSPATGAPGTGPYMPAGQVDIGTMAGAAIDRAGDQRVEVSTLPAAQTQMTAPEPVRHKVARGETAYTISRLYNVSVRSLADWNSLDENYTIREGQFLLIPVAVDAPGAAPQRATELPGTGSPTPVPPSASAPLPAEQTQPLKPPQRTDSSTASPTAPAPTPTPAPTPSVAPNLGQSQSAAPRTQMDYPVKGRIIRDFAKGKSDGIDIAADSGTAVRAAKDGTVAAITSDADNVRVIVVRHEGKLLTIYSNVANIAVKEGMNVSRGQKLAEVRGGSSPYVHFEVRKGLEATDPMDYLQ